MTDADKARAEGQAERVRALLTRVADDMPGGAVIPPARLMGLRPGANGASGAPGGARRGRLAYLAGAFVLVVLAVTVPTLLLDRHRPSGPVPLPGYAVPTVDAYPTTGPGTAAALAAARWHALPTAPIVGRSFAATAWDGTEMLIWGGASGDTGSDPLLADGAAFNPSTSVWRMLPTAPLAARSNAASVWTGHELFIWGGYRSQTGDAQPYGDGALFDPATQQWRMIAQSPLSARHDATALWTGAEVIVIGGVPAALGSDTYVDLAAAAYNPATNSWRTLPAIPSPAKHDAAGVSAVAVAGGVYAWVDWQHMETDANGSTGNAGVDGWRYQADTGTWAAVDVGDRRNLDNPLWTGKELLFPAQQTWYGFVPGPMQSNLAGWRLDPATGAWRTTPHGPVDDLRGRSLWTGGALLTYDTGTSVTRPDGTGDHPGEGAVWNPVTNAWTRIADAPFVGTDGTSSVWTGSEVLEWGLLYGSPDSAGGPSAATTAGLRLGS